jgi:hypothetical protein
MHKKGICVTQISQFQEKKGKVKKREETTFVPESPRTEMLAGSRLWIVWFGSQFSIFSSFIDHSKSGRMNLLTCRPRRSPSPDNLRLGQFSTELRTFNQ